MGSTRTFFTRKLSLLGASIIALLGIAFPADAIIDANLQMQLGNPTGATADTTNHNHYLIQRTVEAIDYSDNLRQPNWASWDLTASDYVVGGHRSGSFYTDTSLPAGFLQVTSSTYNNSGWDRGHMCPSADRTDNTTDNNLVFLMSNIIPQNPNENQVVWGSFEDYSRSMLSTQELLITCGPRNFGTSTVGGQVVIPSNNWKIVVCVPLGSGTAYDRLTNSTAASIRVIAIDIPNAPQTNPWQSFITSAKQLQDLTGFSFFSALPNNLAWNLRSKVDGQAAVAPSFGTFTPSSGSQSNSVTLTGGAFDTITNVSFNGTSAPYSITATNQITTIVPVGASTGQITVKGLGGNATSASSFTVAPPVLPDFTISPSGSFTSSGSQGGSFSPSTQIFTLTNTNSPFLNWGVGKNAAWLDVSATSGILLAGGSTDITVSVNATANSLPGGVYSDTVTFSNSTTGGWVPRSVELTVLTLGQLSVSSVITFNATTQVGGPFSPSSTDYTLSNTGSVSLNWTASKTASWLTLSATSGTLGAGASTVVTATITSNAISLAQGNYSDVIGFTNTTNFAGDTTRGVSLDVISFGFFDNFGTFSSGDLVGQSSWQEAGATNVLWTFQGDNTNSYAGQTIAVVGNIAADVGSGVASGQHASASSSWTAPAGNGSFNSWGVDHWAVNDFFQFQVSTLGIAGIKLDWDQTSSGTGPRDFVLQYSTNGTFFTTVGAYTVLANTAIPAVRTNWNSTVFDPAYHYSNDLSAVTALDDQPNVYFRLVCNSTTNANGGSVTGATGSDRVDNFLVSRLTASSIQISGGAAWIPANQPAIKPDATKDFLLTTNVTVFAGMVVDVTNAPVVNSGTPSFFAALASVTGDVGDVTMTTYQLTAKAGDNGNTNYVLGARTTGESGAPFVFGTTALSYGTSYRVIIRTDPLGSNTTVYVNPTSTVLGAQTPYLTAAGGSGITPATSLDSFILNENKNGSAATVGAGISKVCAASDYASVYNFLSAGLQVASFTGTPTIGAAPLNVVFTDTSTGTISNRFWNFGDSHTTNVTTNVVSHTYSAGTYTVTLIVSGTGGMSTNTQIGYITSLTAFEAWQIQYFGSTNGSAAATADFDGDGQNNFAEFQAGTNPTNSASAFRIVDVEAVDEDVLLTWTTVGGKKYAVQSVTGGDYTNAFIEFVPAFVAPGTNESTISVIHIGAATNTPAGYYRIRLVP